MADGTTLSPTDLSPNFINPAYATPEQIASLRLYADQLQKPQPVKNWAQGLSEMTRALMGGYMGYRADQREGQAIDSTAQQAVPAYAAVAGLTGAAPASPAAPSASPADATAPATQPQAPTAAPDGLASNFPAYASAVQRIENPTGDPNAVSSAGARGPYQFTSKTWAQFGQGDPTDPKAATAALARLTASNFSDLKANLGRDPTPGELYLAHQQGASGATMLLKNPGARAGDIVGDAAVRQNGGDPNMPAGQFANKWIGQFQRGFQPSAASPSAPPTAPATAPFDSNKTYLPATDTTGISPGADQAGALAQRSVTPVIDPRTGAPTAFAPSGPMLPASASATGAFRSPASFSDLDGKVYSSPGSAPAAPSAPPNPYSEALMAGSPQGAAPPPGAPVAPPVQSAPSAAPSSSAPPQVAQAVAGMTPQQISMIMNNPRTTPETKALVSALIMPKTIAGPFGSTYVTTLADQAAGRPPRPYMEPGEKGTIKVGNLDVPTITTGTPSAPTTRFLAPGMAPGQASPAGAPGGTQPPGTAPAPAATAAGPLPQSIVDLSTQGARLAAQQKGFEDEGAKTADILSKYKDAGIEARGQMNQIDALSALGSRVGYGITPVVQQELGKLGLQTKGLPDIEAYQSVVNNLIPNLRPPGSGTLKDSEIEAFKSAVGGLMTTIPGRQLIAQNLKLMAQYKAAVSDIAGDTSLPQDARMARIQALEPPKLQLSASTDQAPAAAAQSGALAAATAQNGPGRMVQPLRPTATAEARLAEARHAISRHAPADAVRARLIQLGIDPNRL